VKYYKKYLSCLVVVIIVSFSAFAGGPPSSLKPGQKIFWKKEVDAVEWEIQDLEREIQIKRLKSFDTSELVSKLSNLRARLLLLNSPQYSS
jgi:hypothetical protein